jgi:hypothetical protein
MLIVGALVLAGCAEARPPASTAAPAAAPAASRAAAPEPAGALFDFHIGFWVNLHQRLYAESGLRPVPDPLRAPAVEDQAAWDTAVALYRQRFPQRDLLTLLTNEELARLNHELGSAEPASDLAASGVAPELRAALEAAAPVYRRQLWPADEQADRALVARLGPMVASHGAALSSQLARAYQAPWPTAPIRVEVARYAGPVGAYTDDRITMAARDPRHDGNAALEIVFHEASHLLSEPLDHIIAEACAAKGRGVPPGLWHAILFYMTGELVRRELGAGYVAYADRNGLWTRGPDFAAYQPLLTRFLPEYLDGKHTLRAAIDQIIAGLPPSS